MLRKFLLVAFMALVEPGSTVQLVSAQLICFGYVLLLVNMSPCVWLLATGRRFGDKRKAKTVSRLGLWSRCVGRYKKDEADFTNQARPPCRLPPASMRRVPLLVVANRAMRFRPDDHVCPCAGGPVAVCSGSARTSRSWSHSSWPWR